MTGARRVGELLRVKDSALSTLVRGAQRQAEFDKQFHALIDAPICEHVHVASATDGVLTLAADTSVWGHRIRYLAPAVLEQLRHIDPSLREVKIIVRPPRADPGVPDPPSRRASLSEASASLLGGIAASCENPELAKILKRLSNLSTHSASQTKR